MAQMRFGERQGHAESASRRLAPTLVALVLAVGLFAYSQRSGRLDAPGEDVTSAPSAKEADSPLARTEVPASDPSTPLLPVDPRYFEDFEDRSAYIPPEAFYHLLDLANRNSPAALAAAAQTVTMVELAREPEKYRGKIIALRGRVRRIIEFPCQKNPHGLTKGYEAWLFTSEAGRLPYVINSALPPIGLPVKPMMNEPARAVGYFLGFWRHETEKPNVFVSSPIVIGPWVEAWDPAEGVKPVAPPWVGYLLGAAILGLLASAYYFGMRGTGTSTSPAALADGSVFEALPSGFVDNPDLPAPMVNGKAHAPRAEP